MSGRPKHPKYARNKNVIVIGGSGSGKTRFFVKPNLMQMPEKVSYVCTDPKGTIIIECGKMLSDAGYKIKVLNTINFKKSMHYNPFHYIRSEKDILKLVNTIIANTKGDGEKSGEDFWVKAERLLYCALIGYIYYEAPEEEQNFSTLLEFINASEAREDDEEFKNPVDELFEDLEKAKPEHFAVRQYKKYKLAAGVVSLKRLLNQSNLKSWSSKMIKKSLEAYFFTLKNKIVFCKKQFQNMSVFCFVTGTLRTQLAAPGHDRHGTGKLCLQGKQCMQHLLFRRSICLTAHLLCTLRRGKCRDPD